MTTDRAEISRRLRAARALAVPTADELEARRLAGRRADATLTVEELAERALVKANGITANLIGETERANRDARPMELTVIAQACGLSDQFFNALDAFMPAKLESRLERVELALEGLLPLSGAEDDVRRTLGDLPSDRSESPSEAATRASRKPPH